MKKRTINCIQCDEPFDFSVSEQKYFAAKGFDEPTRCPECRKKKKSAGEDSSIQRKRKKKHSRIHQDEDEWD